MTVEITDHPLYDMATEQAVHMTPPDLSADTLLPLPLVQQLMASMWIQGLTWGAMNPQQAVSATMNIGERMKQELTFVGNDHDSHLTQAEIMACPICTPKSPDTQHHEHKI